ncbi:MAG: flagellar biosynthesis anti-sigma factor FlgM [Myxococcales bacterium]|nr:flagellar biosynthesis anti-sigma factor FlgM [Myxococcales bacterium]
MKVNDTHTAVPLQAANSSTTPARAKEEKDRVSLERARELQADIERAKLAASAGRAAQLQALEAAIRNGAFRPSPQQLAEKLLQSAELDARLRALLNG